MAIKFNDKEITQVVFNEKEMNLLFYNEQCYYSKRFTVHINPSSGASIRIFRSNSFVKDAVIGYIDYQDPIYFGDIVTISVSAVENYVNPELYVDIGDGAGMLKREASLTFEVINDVNCFGSATLLKPSAWETVWKGVREFDSDGVFVVPGLESGGDIQITAQVTFEDCYIEDEETIYPGSEFSGSVNRSQLPVTIYGNVSSVEVSRNGSNIKFEFVEGWEYAKGFVLYEAPKTITITEVRRKA